MNTKWLVRWLLCLCLPALLWACGDDDDDNDDQPDDDTTDDDDDDDNDDDDDDNDDNDDDNNDDDDNNNDDDTSAIPLGVYEISGEDGYGEYTGQVELTADEKGTAFTRVAYYADWSFPDPYLDLDYEVHTAWTGDLTDQTIAVRLRVADFMTAYADLVRSEDDGLPVDITGAVTSAGEGSFTVAYQSAPESLYPYTGNESWTYQGPSGATPIFVDEDTTIETHKPMPGFLHDLVFLIMAEYHQLELFDDYRDRPEFEAGVHFYHHKRTDFDWYRASATPRLRVVNKWLDEIGLAETMLRARAYTPTLAQKAAWFDEDMPLYFMNDLGFYGNAQVGTVPLEFDESGDADLWSGCYLGSQAWRYLTTGEAEALANWLFVLDGLLLAHDIPQDPTTFARAVRPHEEDGNKVWVQGAPPYETYDWLTEGNNDMIQGLYYGYAMSLAYLPEDAAYDEYRELIAERAVRFADFDVIARDNGFNEIKANLLAYAATGEERFLERFDELWGNLAYKFWMDIGNGMFYLWGISDWSGQHLNTTGQLILQVLADATGVDMAPEMRNAWVNGMRLNALTGQILWPVGAYAFANPPADTDDVLAEAIWGLREMPFPKQNFATDQRIDPEWCASPIPSLFWKLDWMTGGRFQGLYGNPLFERDASETYFNGGPFSVAAGASPWFGGGGADFLHAYWLGRYFGVIDETE